MKKVLLTKKEVLEAINDIRATYVEIQNEALSRGDVVTEITLTQATSALWLLEQKIKAM